MSAPSRRKAKRRIITFTLVVEAQEMIVQYEANWMTDVGHFEFRSPHQPRRPIPISETGYLSYFADMKDIEAAPSPQAFARDAALAMLRSDRGTDAEDEGQLSLF
jgi:hypothetical protein